jgi:hypothetical protein
MSMVMHGDVANEAVTIPLSHLYNKIQVPDILHKASFIYFAQI